MANDEEQYHVGTTIAGRYRIESPIGEGAMGRVALARHESLDEKVAIKFLRPELRRDPVAIARLSREARALARIKTDHVARVLDVGATLAIGPYMVMEYLEGTDLGDLLEAEGPLPVERVVELAMQICEALTVAHTAGIVHRDLKPQNLFLARHGQFETLKVLDFGIAEEEPGTNGRDANVASRDRALPTALYGTPSYMSPERIRNEPTADHRADIWSIGVVLHELVTGRALFDAPTTIETCARVLSDTPIPLEANDAVLPPSLRSIIARCLERDPARRYQSIEELAAATAPLGSMTERFRGRTTGAFSRQFVAEQLALANAPPPQLPIHAAASSRRDEAPTAAAPPARRRSVGKYGAAALVSGLVIALVASLGGHDPRPAPLPTAERGARLEPGQKVAVRGQDVPVPPASIAAPAPNAELGQNTRAVYSPSEEETPPPQPRRHRALRTVESNEEATASPPSSPASESVERAKPSRAARAKWRRKRAAAKLALLPKDGPAEEAAEDDEHRGARRTPRIELVKERDAAGRKRAAAEPTDESADDDEQPAAPPARGARAPDWLESMRGGAKQR